MALIAAVIGMTLGLGIWLIGLGWRGVSLGAGSASNTGMQRVTAVDRVLLRAALAVGAILLIAGLTRWPVIAAGAGITGWMAPTWWSGRDSYRQELAIVEAIATWTEQLRDTLAAAHGLEHAVASTAVLAPSAIAPAVERLAARLEYTRMSDSLRRFADDVDHPLADFVTAALITATEGQARELGGLLSHLAESARDEAKMRTRVWVGRARNRSAVRIIASVICAFILGLLLFNRSYLAPYDSAGGQVILAGVAAMFAAALVMMRRMGDIALPERFVGRRLAVGEQ